MQTNIQYIYIHTWLIFMNKSKTNEYINFET